MTVLFEEMTREQIKAVAPGAIAVLPTTEQHGPHMAVGTDTLLTTVARRNTDAIAAEVPWSSRQDWVYSPFQQAVKLLAPPRAGGLRELPP